MTNTVLKALMPSPTRLGSITTKEVQAITGLNGGQVTDAITSLVTRGYAQRCSHGVFKITPEGLEALGKGKKVTSGVTGPRLRSPFLPTSFRTRLWRALRHKRKGTVRQLMVLASRGTERDAQNDARKYFTALMRAGFVRRLEQKEGHEYRWLILRDTGPLAPQFNRIRQWVFDANTGTTYDLTGDARVD